MAQTGSAKKRIRQNETGRLRNRSRMGRVRTAMKAVVKAAEAAASSDGQAEGADRDRADALYRKAASELDRAASRRIIHPNAAARRKSRLAKRLQKAFAARG